MKKFLNVGLVVCFIILIAFSTKSNADMGGPMIKPYDVYVTKVGGAKYYSNEYDEETKKIQIVEKGTIDYNKKININAEEKIGNEIYGLFSLNTDSNTYNLYLINLKDVSKLEEKYEQYDVNSKKTITVLAEDGVEMYEGPSYAYEPKNLNIPKGTILDAFKMKDSYDIPWLYVTYNGKNGWICELNGVIGYKSEYTSKLKMLKNTYIFKNIEDENKYISDDDYYKNEEISIGKIPANVEITNFKSVDPWSWSFYVTYNGVSGYVKKHDCAFDINYDSDYNYKVNYQNCNIYEYTSEGSKILLENIPVGTEIHPIFEEDIRATGWLYGTYNNVTGWIYFAEEEMNYVPNLDAEFDEDSFYSDSNYEKYEDDIENKDTDIDVIEYDNEIPAMQMLLICCGTAIIISLMVCVTIILVNKNNNQKIK